MLARDSKRYKVLTKNTYGKTVIKESQVAAMEEFIDNIKVLINALGFKVLEPAVQMSAVGSEEQEVLYLNAGNASAKGITTTEGFVIFAGAVINQKTSAKSLNKNMAARREKIIASDKVKDYVTTEDILFSSSSAAADFVTGYSVSGPANWKNSSGKTLKEIESEETK